MKKFIFFAAILASCSSPPSRPASLWDPSASSEPAEPDSAKTLPAQNWNAPEAPGDSAENADSPAEPESVVGTVVLNEICYDAAESDTDGHVFVELFGTPGLPIGRYQVAFVNGSDGGIYDSIMISEGARLRDDGFFLIADTKNGSSTTSNVLDADLLDNFDPQNGPDAVQLLDPTGALVDVVGYGEGITTPAKNGLLSFEGTPAPDVVGGHCLERAQAGADTRDNSADFVDREIPTPGSSPVPVLSESEIELQEMEPDQNPPNLPNVLDPTDPPDPPDPPDPKDPEPANEISEIVAPKIVLNEIYYDAVGSDTDGVLFIELYGAPGADIGKDVVHFVNGDDGAIYDSIFLPDQALMPDDGFYVIADARNGSSTETNVLGANWIDSFDLQNGPDSVQFLDRDGTLLDAVGYGPVSASLGQNGLATFETNPAMDPASGRSLERKEAGVDTDDNAADFVEREIPTPGE